jgi:alpha-N-arabinofuranosidase
MNFWKRDAGVINMKVSLHTLKELENPAFLAVRQLEYTYEAVMEFAFEPLLDEEAGFTIMQSNQYYIQFRIKNVGTEEENKLILQVVKCTAGEDQILAEKRIEVADYLQNPKSEMPVIKLKIDAKGQKANFTLCSSVKDLPILNDLDIHEMSTEIAGGFVGNTLGAYASSCGKNSDNQISIYDFSIKYN